MRVLPFRLALALLLGLAVLPFGVALGGDGDPVPANPPGDPKPGDPKPDAKPGDEPVPDDGADDKVPFVEEVNRAIEQGVLWLKAKPTLFPIHGDEVAHWGLIHGDLHYNKGVDVPEYRHPAGPSALSLYTLLKCGVDPMDPVIQKGFLWLKLLHEATVMFDGQAMAGNSWTHTQAGSSYELSAMILALTAKYDHFKRTKNSVEAAKKGRLKIPDKDDREWLSDLVTALVERRGLPQGDLPPEGRLGWRYNVPSLTLGGNDKSTRTCMAPPNGAQDVSSTQLATMALYSANRFGAKVDPQVWFDIVEFVLAQQEETGPERVRLDPVYSSGGYAAPKDHARGFMYIKGSPEPKEGVANGSMTACGVSVLLMAKDVLLDGDRTRKAWIEKGLDKKVETAVWDGLAWLDLNWSPFTNPKGMGRYSIYYLYALERAMDILGKNLVGTHLWYTEGAQEILKVQQKARVIEKLKKGSRETDGVFWQTNQTVDPKDVLDTCFALLFLKRATKGLVPPTAVTGSDSAPADNR